MEKKEAMKILKDFYDKSALFSIRTALDTVIPELSESKDEKIRKEIAVMVNFFYGTNLAFKHSFSKNEMLAWLEKQAEHANFRNKIQIGDKVTRNEDGVLVNLSQLKRVAKPDEKQGESYTKRDVDDAYLKGVTDTKKEIEKQYEAYYQIRKDIATFIFNYRGDIKQRYEWIKCLGFDVEFSNEEKQAEQKPVFEMKTPEESLGVDSDTYNKIVDECIYGEQKPADKVEPKFKAGDKIISTISNIPYYITEVCKGHYLTDVGCIIMFNAQDNFELVEQKPAWSEEDEDTIKFLINHFCVSHCNRSFQFTSNKLITHDELLEKIRNLRPQSQWKPSDEQMEALDSATENCVYSEYQDCLRELIGQLKKLREG